VGVMAGSTELGLSINWVSFERNDSPGTITPSVPLCSTTSASVQVVLVGLAGWNFRLTPMRFGSKIPLTLAFLDSIGLNLTFCRGIARAAPGIIVPEDSPPADTRQDAIEHVIGSLITVAPSSSSFLINCSN